MQIERSKYPRTLHLPFSEKAMNDDKILDSMDAFVGKEVVITEKYDGENTTIYSDGYVHARSMEHAKHPGRTYVASLAAQIGGELPVGWRICGENLQARHTIPYNNLPDWFLVFAIFTEDNVVLPWHEMCIWCSILGLHHVRTIREFFTFDIEEIKKLVEEVRSPNLEGFVIRNRDAFHINDWNDNICKFVYKHFVLPAENWMYQPVVLNGKLKE